MIVHSSSSTKQEVVQLLRRAVRRKLNHAHTACAPSAMTMPTTIG